MFAILHVLLNNSALLNHVQSYYPCSHEYTDMQPCAMHCFQWCGGSLKSVSKILGVIYLPLLHWCSQCYMCCSIAPHVNTQSIPEKFMHQFWEWAVHHCWADIRSATIISPTRTSIHNMHHFAMHHFQGCRAHLYEVYDTFNTARHCLVKSC